MALSQAQRIALLLVLTAIIGVSLFTLSTRAVVPGSADRVAFTPAPNQPRPILIDVEGAVGNPGLYWVPEGTRVYEVLGRAGGVRGDAQTGTLAMAGIVHDGERVFVPTEAPPQPWQRPAGVDARKVQPLPVQVGPIQPAVPPGLGSDASLRPAFGSINLNLAPASELARLPKLGPAVAQHIVDYRKLHGPFRDLEDLDAVPGIGRKTIVAISPYVCF
jgi:competence protein ComEA